MPGPFSDKYDLLFIHPQSLEKGRNNILPMGIFGLMNGLTCKKIGKMYYEVTDEVIRGSKIIAMDLHWYFSLFTVEKMAKRIKKINPGVKIILGGYTASIFADILVEKFSIDFVIRGDAEIPFPSLVDRLLKAENLDGLPNIVAKDFATPHSFALTTEIYSAVDNVSLDWFPSYKRLIIRYQKHGLPTNLYPFVPVLRGCIYDCEHCYGSPSLQKKICGRGIVLRSPESVRADLVHYSQSSEIKIVYIIGDFIDFPGLEYANKVFYQKYDLNLYYEFYNLPPIPVLEKALNCFNQCFFCFSSVKNHGEKSGIQDFNNLKDIIEYLKDKNCRVTLFVDDSLNSKFSGYFDEIISLWRKEHHIDLLNIKDWDIDIPYPKDKKEDLQAEFSKFYERSKRNPLIERAKRGFLVVVFRYKYLLLFVRRVHTFMVFVDIYVKSILQRLGGERK